MRTRCYLVLVSIVWFMLALQSIPAQIRFDPNSKHAPMWSEQYKNLSERWRPRRAVDVVEVTDEDMNEMTAPMLGPGDGKDDIIGFYLQHTLARGGMIVLRESLAGDDAKLTFLHEYGHYIWANALSGSEKRKFEAIWKSDRRTGHLVSGYARTNVGEGWAEAFAMFVTDPDTLLHDDPKEFVLLTIFEGG